MEEYRKGLHEIRDRADLKEFEGKDYACMHSIFLQIEQNHLLTEDQKRSILLDLLFYIETNGGRSI